MCPQVTTISRFYYASRYMQIVLAYEDLRYEISHMQTCEEAHALGLAYHLNANAFIGIPKNYKYLGMKTNKLT
jgi:hypothetical protein